MSTRVTRRDFLAGSASLAAVLAALHGRRSMASPRASQSVAGPYGRLRPVADLETGLPLILLPDGFEYRTFSWTGDAMANGEPAPDLHDGMGVIAAGRNDGQIDVTLVRNHERAIASPIIAPARYDAAMLAGQGFAPAGGTTTLRFRGRRWLRAESSLGGTIYNCAGGVTPWGTWLSCEETVIDRSAKGGKRHGYVFEVRRDSAETTGRPIVAMGRMCHEAVAIDPGTRIAYLTEDEDQARCSGFYRFMPKERNGIAGSYEAGGRLQAARVVGRANADLVTPQVGDLHEIQWVDIENPDADSAAPPVELSPPPASNGKIVTASGPFLQAWSQGALRLSRAEGICHHAGKFYLVDTEAGIDAEGRRGHGEGAVWEYDPQAETLRAIFVAGSQQVGDNIDNIVVSPRGGMLLCEDGDSVTDVYRPGTRLIGITAEGDSYAFAMNNVSLTLEQVVAAGKRIFPRDYRGEEWAGACFDPDGEVLFVNIQTPGITFAIWGPWERGNL
ncbi:MAG: alkaline phosphatase PhoX [Steroidobacteraceae bacterium]